MIACRSCGKIPKSRRLRGRKHYTCGACIKAALANPSLNSNLVEIRCDGCGRTQQVRRARIIPCDGYTCSLGSCRLNPDFRTPTPPEGFVCALELNVAGGFSGYRVRLATLEDRQAIARARAIRDAGIVLWAQEQGEGRS